MTHDMSSLTSIDLSDGMPPTFAKLVASSEPEPEQPKDTSTRPNASSIGPRRWERWPTSPQLGRSIEAWVEHVETLIGLYNSGSIDEESHHVLDTKLEWKGWKVYDAAGSDEDRAKIIYLRQLFDLLRVCKEAYAERQYQLAEQITCDLRANRPEPTIKSTDELLQREDQLLIQLYPGFIASEEVGLNDRLINQTWGLVPDTRTPSARNRRGEKTSRAPRRTNNTYPPSAQKQVSRPAVSSFHGSKIPTSSTSAMLPHPQQPRQEPRTPGLIPADRIHNLVGTHPPSTLSPMKLSPSDTHAPTAWAPSQQQPHVTVSPGGTHYYTYAKPTPTPPQQQTHSTLHASGNYTSQYTADQSADAATPGPAGVTRPAYWNPNAAARPAIPQTTQPTPTAAWSQTQAPQDHELARAQLQHNMMHVHAQQQEQQHEQNYGYEGGRHLPPRPRNPTPWRAERGGR